jgi:hypothetical protein
MNTDDNRRRDRREINRQIDSNLKRAFEKLASEPVPDRFTDLLQQLRETNVPASSNRSGGSND